MLCNICNKNKATVHLTEVVNGELVEKHICGECSKQKSASVSEQLNVSDCIGGFISAKGDGELIKKARCECCDLSFIDLRENGRLGCPDCYNVFKTYLMPFMRSVHSATRHLGKTPVGFSGNRKEKTELESLQMALKDAVECEEYEKAAVLRDKINRVGG